jgi:hypothetical protein
MRRFWQRTLYTTLVALIAIACSAIVASPAKAFPAPTELDVAARVQGCPFTGCVQDSVQNAVGTDVMTHCRFSNIGGPFFTIVYTANARGGFVRQTSLANEATQTLDCSSAGIFAQVKQGPSGKMFSCASTTCVDIGDIFSGDALGVFCSVGSGSSKFYLVFDKGASSRDGGFVSAADLGTSVVVSACTV